MQPLKLLAAYSVESHWAIAMVRWAQRDSAIMLRYCACARACSKVVPLGGGFSVALVSAQDAALFDSLADIFAFLFGHGAAFSLALFLDDWPQINVACPSFATYILPLQTGPPQLFSGTMRGRLSCLL